MRRSLISFGAIAAIAASGAVSVSAAIAQSIPVETRVDRLEKEMRAVQRKVFPDGSLPAEPASTTAAAGSPSASPVVDLTARVDSLEKQLASLTGQLEQNNFRVKKLEDAFAKYKAETDAKLGLTAEPAASTTTATTTVAAPSATTPKPAAASPAAKPAASTTPTATKPTTATKPAAKADAAALAARKNAVAAIERPSSGDAAEDAYSYGYRLWSAKFYPEAQTQLQATLDKYGAKSAVASRAQNLLGRAYLDDGKTAQAVKVLYENYRVRPKGDRAADSLAWLGEGLIRLKRDKDACVAYEELEDVYGAKLSSTLRTMVDKGKTKAKCAK